MRAGVWRLLPRCRRWIRPGGSQEGFLESVPIIGGPGRTFSALSRSTTNYASKRRSEFAPPAAGRRARGGRPRARVEDGCRRPSATARGPARPTRPRPRAPCGWRGAAACAGSRSAASRAISSTRRASPPHPASRSAEAISPRRGGVPRIEVDGTPQQAGRALHLPQQEQRLGVAEDAVRVCIRSRRLRLHLAGVSSRKGTVRALGLSEGSAARLERGGVRRPRAGTTAER